MPTSPPQPPGRRPSPPLRAAAATAAVAATQRDQRLSTLAYYVCARLAADVRSDLPSVHLTWRRRQVQRANGGLHEPRRTTGSQQAATWSPRPSAAKTPASIAAAVPRWRASSSTCCSCWDANASACGGRRSPTRAYAGFVDAAAAALDAANGATVSVAAGSYPGSQCLPAEYEQCTAAGDEYEAQCVSGAWDVSTCNCCAYVTWFALEPLCGTRAAAIINMDTYQQSPVNYSAFDGAVAWYRESACAGRVAIGLLAGEVADEDDAARVVRAAAAAASAGEIDIWANLWGASTREAWAPRCAPSCSGRCRGRGGGGAADGDDDVRRASAAARRPLRRYGGAVRRRHE